MSRILLPYNSRFVNYRYTAPRVVALKRHDIPYYGIYDSASYWGSVVTADLTEAVHDIEQPRQLDGDAGFYRDLFTPEVYESLGYEIIGGVSIV